MHQLKIGNCYITTTQLQAANAESIRLGFGRNLDLPPELPELKFPITRAFRHTSSDGELENIRLMIFFSLDTDNGLDGHVLILDVTPDWLVTIRDQTFDCPSCLTGNFPVSRERAEVLANPTPEGGSTWMLYKSLFEVFETREAGDQIIKILNDFGFEIAEAIDGGGDTRGGIIGTRIMPTAEHLGYRLARQYAERYDSRYFNGLIPKSAPFVEDIAEFWGKHFLGRGWKKRLATL